LARTEERLKDALNGRLRVSELCDFEYSALRIHIYSRASAILDLPKPERKKAGESLPADIRDLVRAECQRIIQYRKQKAAPKSRYPPSPPV
jgi:hypothetical protein